jgi:hypothetical protein
MDNKIVTSKREWVDIQAYEDELSGFMSTLHDLLMANANLSAKTITYILEQIETLGEYIGNFPTSHPIFTAIARSNSITKAFSLKVIKLSLESPEVYHALAHNDILSEEERTLYALSAA